MVRREFVEPDALENKIKVPWPLPPETDPFPDAVGQTLFSFYLHLLPSDDLHRNDGGRNGAESIARLSDGRT